MGAVNDQLLLHTTRMKCRPVTRGGEASLQNFSSPWKIVLDIV